MGITNKNLIKNINGIKVEVPNIDEGFSTDTIQEYIPFLDMVWNIGTNVIVGKQTTREYKEIIQPSPLIMKVVEIELEEDHPLFGGKNFYRVTKEFYEDNYRSSNQFYKWDRFRLKYLKEELFYNRLEDTITEEYDSPKIKIFPNKALGISINSNDFFKVLIREYRGETKDTGKISPVTYNYLTILLTKEHQELTIKKYGTTKVQGSDRIHPLGEDINYRDTLIHLKDTEFNKRLKPPGKQHFKDNFINTQEYKDSEYYVERSFDQLNLDTLTERIYES